MPNRKLHRIAMATAILTGILLAITGTQRVDAASGLPATVRDQMDAASKSFTSAQADVRQELFTKVVHDTGTQTGQIYFLRKAGSIEMGMKLLPAGATPGAQPAQVMEFKDGKARMFNPGTNQVDEASAAGKNASIAETFLTLGFGGSATDIAKAWTIDDQGTEQLNDGKQAVKTEKLDLVPKDPSIRNTFSHVIIWIDPTRDVSLKQVFYEASGGVPSGDTRTVFYTNIVLNQKIDPTAFAIKCKGKCNVVTH